MWQQKSIFHGWMGTGSFFTQPSPKEHSSDCHQQTTCPDNISSMNRSTTATCNWFSCYRGVWSPNTLVIQEKYFTDHRRWSLRRQKGHNWGLKSSREDSPLERAAPRVELIQKSTFMWIMSFHLLCAGSQSSSTAKPHLRTSITCWCEELPSGPFICS